MWSNSWKEIILTFQNFVTSNELLVSLPTGSQTYLHYNTFTESSGIKT